MPLSPESPLLAEPAPPVRRYVPDPLVVAGADHARRKGIRNHQFSVIRVGTHAHVINCMHDMRDLIAVVVRGTGGRTARVVPVADDTCPECPQRAVKATEPPVPAVGDVIRGTRNAPWVQGHLLSEPSRVTGIDARGDGTWTIAATTISAPYAYTVRATREQLGAVEFLPPDTKAKPKATEAELMAIDDHEELFREWANAEGITATYGLFTAWAGWNDLGVTERGFLGGVPW
jgi:hypothetical protein